MRTRKWKVQYIVEVEDHLEFDTHMSKADVEKILQDPKYIMKRRLRTMESKPKGGYVLVPLRPDTDPMQEVMVA